MMKLHETIRVARDRPTCYRYLIDFSTCEQWDPAVYRAEKRTPGAPRPGTEFDVVVRAFGQRLNLRYRIESVTAETVIELSVAAGGLRAQAHITLRAIGPGHTEIDYRADFEQTGRGLFTSPALKVWMKRMGHRAAGGLKRALTIDGRPPRQSWLSYAADRSMIAATPSFTDRGYFALADKSHGEYMDDQVVVITGATSGIGRATAAEYARLGATVVMLGRNTQRLAEAATDVRDFAGCAASHVDPFAADLLSIEQTRSAGLRLAARYPRIDVLVNNAGALFDRRAVTDEGVECTVAINLVAPFVLTETLMASLLAGGARVINMSSGGMYLQPLVLEDMNYELAGHYDGTKAYARAKRGMVALTRHWARRYGDTGVHFNAMHPGWVATPGITRSLPGFERVMRRFLRHTRMGADTAVWLGSAHAAAGLNGLFFLDRVPHPTAVLPSTRVLPSQAQSLYGWLRNTTGVPVHGV